MILPRGQYCVESVWQWILKVHYNLKGEGLKITKKEGVFRILSLAIWKMVLCLMRSYRFLKNTMWAVFIVREIVKRRKEAMGENGYGLSRLNITPLVAGRPTGGFYWLPTR